MNVREPADTHVTVGSLTEMMTMLPYLVGFHPRESMVAVCMHGERRRAGLVLRIDLPTAAGQHGWVDELVMRVEHQHADGVLLACYTDAPDDAAGPARSGLARRLREAFEARRIDVHEIALIRGGRWRSYSCDAPGCCPPEGTVLPESPTGAAARFGAEAALQGRQVYGSREDLEACVQAPSGCGLDEITATFTDATRTLQDEHGTDGRAAATERTVALAENLARRYAAGRCDVPRDEAARICVGLAEVGARDRVAALAVDDTAAWLALLAELARHCPDRDAAPICTVLAWVAYQQGEGALANVALDRALSCRPGYTMALLLRDCLDRQISPEVIRRVTRSQDSDVGSRV